MAEFSFTVRTFNGATVSVDVLADDLDDARLLACQLATVPPPFDDYPDDHNLSPISARLDDVRI